MPFPMKIQPVDVEEAAVPAEVPAKPVPSKSRLKRLFERQFPGVLRASAVERIIGGGDGGGKEREREAVELEPSSACLARMVQSFMEGVNEKQPPPLSWSSSRCGRRRSNCFNVNCDDSSDDGFDFFPGAGDGAIAPSAHVGHAADVLKSLVPCASTAERNLLADTARIMDRNCKICCGGGKGGKGGKCRRIVTDGLVALGYDAAICRSRWDKSPSFPAGDYEYVDVIVEGGERLLVDIDFRSEFEIARSTKSYRGTLLFLPAIFVGRPERLKHIVAVASEAASQSLKKKGLHFPPWRKPEYMQSKWLSPHHRIPSPPASVTTSALSLTGELELRRETSGQLAAAAAAVPARSESENSGVVGSRGEEVNEKAASAPTPPWQPPALKPKAPLQKGVRVVTGLASVDREEP